jgi:hypothetical protein
MRFPRILPKWGHRSLFPGFRIGLPRTAVCFSVEMPASLPRDEMRRHGSSPLASFAHVSVHATQDEAGSQRRRSGGRRNALFCSLSSSSRNERCFSLDSIKSSRYRFLAAAHRKRYKGDISSTDLLSSRGTSLCLETGHDGYVPPEQMQVTCNLFGAPAG